MLSAPQRATRARSPLKPVVRRRIIQRPDPSITLSARRSRDGGIVRPRLRVVLRLITSSNFVGCSTGDIARSGAVQNLVHVGGGAPEQCRDVGAVRHEATDFHDDPVRPDRRKPIPGRELDELRPVRREQWRVDVEQAARATRGLEGGFELFRTAPAITMLPNARVERRARTESPLRGHGRFSRVRSNAGSACTAYVTLALRIYGNARFATPHRVSRPQT